MPRDKVIYRETYEPMALNEKFLPVLKHTGPDAETKFVAIGCEIRAAGIIERGGKRMEYQDMRVYVELQK